MLVLPSAAGASFVAAPGSPFAVGANPLRVAVGDMNGDTFPDLVTGNAGSRDLSVLLGNGGGGFADAPGSPFPAGHRPQSLALGDLNGDGHLDAVSTQPSPATGFPGTVSVLLGDGAGGLAESSCSPFAVSFRPVDVAIGDFDEDGIADLAVPNSFLNLGVDILLGDGTGCFTEHPGSPFAAGTDPRSVIVADFDEDGHLDMAVANQDSMDVSILLGDGTGSFAAAPGSPVALGRFGEDTATGDFNEDGHVDLAVSNFTFFSVSVLLGDGAGGFVSAPGSPFSVGALTHAVAGAVGDFNADAHLDLASVGTNENSTTVLLGDGSGSFAQAPGSPYAVGTTPQSIASSDFNVDGSADLATANTGSSNVTVLLSVPDAAPPTIDCIVPDALRWYGDNVSVACTASDGGSGLANAADASFSLSTSVPDGTETDDASTGTRQVCDHAGNCTTAGPYGPFKVDRLGPSLTCLGVPTFILRQSGAAVSAEVSDGGSGPLDSPVSGAADTSSVGQGSSEVTGSDRVGNMTGTICSFAVHYATNGFLAPVANPPAVNTGKAGKVVPLKWQLQDANGAYISDLSAVVRALVKPSPCDDFSTDPTGAIPARSTRGQSLQYDSATNSYGFKWSTATLEKGCYSFLLELDSGQIVAAYFSLS